MDEIRSVILISQIFRIVFTLCSLILAYSQIKMKLGHKANGMAANLLEVSILLSMQLWLLMQENYGLYPIKLGVCTGVIEILQIITLLICINVKEEQRIINKWSTLIGVAALAGGGLIFIQRPAGFQTDYISAGKGIEIAGCILGFIIIVLIYFRNHIGIQGVSSKRKIRIYCLIGIKMSCYLGIIAEIITGRTWIYLLISILQVLFCLIIMNDIEELVIKVSWEKVTPKIKMKNEKVTEGYSEQKILVEASQAIHEKIGSINQKILNLELRLLNANEQVSEKYIGKIKNNCFRLLRLSDYILDLNTYEASNRVTRFEVTNMSMLVGSVVESLETYIGQSGIEIKYSPAGPEITAEVERDAIERILINLISNAVKYNVEHGKIEVILGETRKAVYLYVKDTGIGIPAESQKMIFQKFKRVDSNFTKFQEGSGLGLSIVKSLVDLHHGQIKIISNEGKGTLMSIELPKQQRKRKNKKEAVTLAQKI